MKNQKKSTGLTFEKKAITELQKNESTTIEGGDYRLQLANATRAAQTIADYVKYTQK